MTRLMCRLVSGVVGLLRFSMCSRHSQQLDDTTDVSVVVHMNIDRFFMMTQMLAHWPGPISVAVLTTPGDRQKVVSRFRRVLKRRNNVLLHLVVETVKSYYPINLLRNVALDGLGTSHGLLLDIDFCVFPVSLYSRLQHWITAYSSPYDVLVVPAFEEGYDVPLKEGSGLMDISDKQELLQLVQSKRLRPFHFKKWVQAHQATNYDRWYKTSSPYPVQREMYSHYYEPYIVVKKTTFLPAYDQGFFGYGYNKHEFIIELISFGYSFTVLPDCFVVHMGHLGTKERRQTMDEGGQTRQCNRRLYTQRNHAIVQRNQTMKQLLDEWVYTI